MFPSDVKILSSKESIPSDISTLEKFDTDRLQVFWRTFKNSRNVIASGHRLENLFWRIWGSERLRTRLSGSRIALLFMTIQQGEEAIGRENPELRIPEYSQRKYRAAIAAGASAMQRPSVDIPPTPPPSPIDPMMQADPLPPLMLRLPSQSDITASLQKAFPQPVPPARSSPPGPPRVPPPSPVTPCASPLLGAVQPVPPPGPVIPQQQQIQQPQASLLGARPMMVTSNSDNVMNSANPNLYQQPSRLTSSNSTTIPPTMRPLPTRSSSSTLIALDETAAVHAQQQYPPKAQLTRKQSSSALSIAESTNSSTTSTKPTKKATGKAGAKGGKKGKAKFVAGKKGGATTRPALLRNRSSATSSATVAEHEEDEDEFIEDLVIMKEPEVGKRIRHKVFEEPVAEVVEDVPEDEDEYVDEEPAETSNPMKRQTSGGLLSKKGKNKKGSSTRLNKKHRNTSANAGKTTAGLGIAALLGGPGTTKAKEEAPKPELQPQIALVEPNFRQKFQERTNLARPLLVHETASSPVTANNPPHGHSDTTTPTNTISISRSSSHRRREKLVFLTSETEARAVKSQATVSIATPSSGTAVARKMQGKNLLVVGAGDIKGLSSVGPVGMTTKIGFTVEQQVVGGKVGRSLDFPQQGGEAARVATGMGTAPAMVRGKSTLSMMIEDARRKEGSLGGASLSGSGKTGKGI